MSTNETLPELTFAFSGMALGVAEHPVVASLQRSHQEEGTSDSFISFFPQHSRPETGIVGRIPDTQVLSIPILKCPECPRLFKDSVARDRHQRWSHRLECLDCNERFKSRSTLLRHCNAKHGRDKNLKCHLCGKAFAHKQNKSRHMLSAHNVISK